MKLTQIGFDHISLMLTHVWGLSFQNMQCFHYKWITRKAFSFFYYKIWDRSNWLSVVITSLKQMKSIDLQLIITLNIPLKVQPLGNVSLWKKEHLVIVWKGQFPHTAQILIWVLVNKRLHNTANWLVKKHCAVKVFVYWLLYDAKLSNWLLLLLDFW